MNRFSEAHGAIKAAIVLVAASLAAILVGAVVLWVVEQRASDDLEKARSDRARSLAEIKRIEDEIGPPLERLADLEVRRAKLESQRANAQRKLAEYGNSIKVLQAKISGLEADSDLVQVPNVAGEDLSEAESTLYDLGLETTRVLIEFTCADFKGHFDVRDLGEYDVVKQQPPAGSWLHVGDTVYLAEPPSEYEREEQCDE